MLTINSVGGNYKRAFRATNDQTLRDAWTLVDNEIGRMPNIAIGNNKEDFAGILPYMLSSNITIHSVNNSQVKPRQFDFFLFEINPENIQLATKLIENSNYEPDQMLWTGEHQEKLPKNLQNKYQGKHPLFGKREYGRSKGPVDMEIFLLTEFWKNNRT